MSTTRTQAKKQAESAAALQDDFSSEPSTGDMIDRFELMLSRVTKAMTDTFNTCVEKLIQSLDQKMTQRIDFQTNDIFELNKRLDSCEKSIKHLRDENSSLKDQVKSLDSQVAKLQAANDDAEQYTRNENLLIHGVPLPSDNSQEKNLNDVVLSLLTKNFPSATILSSDISTSHRTGPGKKIQGGQDNQSAGQDNQSAGQDNQSAGQRVRTPPIVVRFTRRCVRNTILSLRKQLKGKNLSITEQLTPARSQLLKKASGYVSDKKLEAAWSHDGRILVKTNADRTVVINTVADLLQFQ